MEVINKVRRVLKKPPIYILKRIILEARIGADRFFNSRPDRRIDLKAFLKLANSSSVDELWKRHSEQSFATRIISPEDLVGFLIERPETVKLIKESADNVLKGNINLLGTGDIFYGDQVVWNRDYKTDKIWPNRYYRDINYVDFQDKSDVKIPWEISRMQWLIPVGQAYLITKDEKYADFVKCNISDWIRNNPYAHSINWTCTMEVALRIIIWEWFFHVFSNSISWNDQAFRFDFLKSLYLHSDFTGRNLEKSDVNGNHYTADGAGLVFAGLFFQGYRKGEHFFDIGWRILSTEIELQVFPDGVDYEASIPYHRLVTELFYFPALYMIRAGKTVPKEYINRLAKMGEFSQSYSRYDGSVPLVGDADDARTLPMGLQKLNDHTYLAPLIGLTFDIPELLNNYSNASDEVFWILGIQMQEYSSKEACYKSKAFKDGGVYIMGHQNHHIFIDCGPLGLADRGGHGHNDVLSFDAMLHGKHLISDCGAYLYTADYLERNNFRSTAYHNTPQVDDEEINRFINPKYLWNFENDAQYELLKWQSDENVDIFAGTHNGYLRLTEPVRPVRHIILEKNLGALIISDNLEGSGSHKMQVPLHLAPSVQILSSRSNEVEIISGTSKYKISWYGQGWTSHIDDTRISPSYGVCVPSKKVTFLNPNALNSRLTVLIQEDSIGDVSQQLKSILAKAL